MTMRALNTYESKDSTLATSANRERTSAVKEWDTALPSLNLRKRSISCERDLSSPLPCVNSAFLSGLFAEVAEIEAESCTKSNPTEVTHVARFVEHCPVEETGPSTRSIKKSRLSLSRSISRCEQSFMNLHDLTFPTAARSISFSKAKSTLCREDSLAFQLQCVSNSSNDAVNTAPSITHAVGELVFPHLPTTVSISSSCNTLTRNFSDLQSSLAEKDDKECYGWFVEMEDGIPARDAANPYPKMTDLAFVAPTAPNAVNHDDEVEWAKAADTVDDVLADFF